MSLKMGNICRKISRQRRRRRKTGCNRGNEYRASVDFGCNTENRLENLMEDDDEQTLETYANEDNCHDCSAYKNKLPEQTNKLNELFEDILTIVIKKYLISKLLYMQC